MKRNSSTKIKQSSNILPFIDQSLQKSSRFSTSSQRKILKFDTSPSKSNFALNIKSPQSRSLKPIGTLQALTSKSGHPTPIKLTSSKQKLIISPRAEQSNVFLKSSLEPLTLIPKSRRTISMPDPIHHTILDQPSVGKCFFKTRVGSIAGRSKKQNQDSFIISNNLKNLPNSYFFAVCDGHGQHGHTISRYIKQHLVPIFDDNLQDLPPTKSSIEQSFSQSVKILEDLLDAEGIDTDLSGSTLVAVIITGKLIVCGNIGDSRAVLGISGNCWTAEPLSRDHKPDIPEETLRIKEHGGRVMSYISNEGLPVGPARVWLKEEYYPGLAMSRSVGDSVAAAVGVCSDPEFSSRTLSAADKFLIIASDGLWEFMSNKDAVKIVAETENNPQTCCDKLVTEAVKRWNKNEGSVDDITVLVVFFTSL